MAKNTYSQSLLERNSYNFLILTLFSLACFLQSALLTPELSKVVTNPSF